MPAKREKTATQKDLEVKSNAVKAAREKAEKNDNETTRKAVEHAVTAYRATLRTVNRERFVEVGANRVSKAIVAVRNLAKVFNPRTYTFEQPDTDKVMTALRNEMKALEAAVNAGLTAGSNTTKATPEKVFTF